MSMTTAIDVRQHTPRFDTCLSVQIERDLTEIAESERSHERSLIHVLCFSVSVVRNYFYIFPAFICVVLT